jgi:hypothetical protein
MESSCLKAGTASSCAATPMPAVAMTMASKPRSATDVAPIQLLRAAVIASLDETIESSSWDSFLMPLTAGGTESRRQGA